MRPRRSPSLGLVLAASLILAIPAQADLCSRLPRWAEAPCGFLGGWFGAVGALESGPAMGPLDRGRMEAAPREEGPAMDPGGRVVPPPGSSLVTPNSDEESLSEPLD